MILEMINQLVQITLLKDSLNRGKAQTVSKIPIKIIAFLELQIKIEF